MIASLQNTPETIPLPDEVLSPAGTEGSERITIVEPRSGWSLLDLSELYRFRELLFFLIWRDVKVRYKQTALGLAWALVQPLGTMLVFVVFLNRLGGLGSEIDNYPIFVLCAAVPWVFFSSAVNGGSLSVLSNERLVTKVYFPRLLVPWSAVGAALFDLAISCGMMAIGFLILGVMPSWTVIFAPIILGLLILAATGFATFFSALIVMQRDIRHVLGFAMQLWMFATPCIYMPAAAPESIAAKILPLNPAYGLILNFRQCVLGGPIEWYSLVVSSLVGLSILLVGLLYFRRVEQILPDRI
jgi:lipopolysaccharide transport system permease protein